jgi:hypothetical protein
VKKVKAFTFRKLWHAKEAKEKANEKGKGEVRKN